MTGSSLAPVIIPIVVVISLALWLIMVLRADSHPQQRHHIAPSPRQGPGQAIPPGPRPQVPHPRARPADKAGPGGRIPHHDGRAGTVPERTDPLAPSRPAGRVPAGHASR